MSSAITEHNLFKPRPSRTETKADVTSHVARAIVGAETERREAKTARLRQARLENEARLAALPLPPEKHRGKAAKPRSRSSS